MTKQNRKSLSPKLAQVRAWLPEVLQVLQQGQKNWYCSVFVESRRNQSFSANLKKQASEESIQEGIVLRVYDGYTLHESAMDSLDREQALERARSLVRKLLAIAPRSAEPKWYSAATWADRLREPLDPEIREQIPAQLKPSTPVHFGVIEHQSLWTDPREAMGYVVSALSAMRAYADNLPAGDPCAKPDYIKAEVALKDEQYLFLDAEVNLSQALSRNRLMLYVTKGKDYGYVSQGGLGGRETVQFTKDTVKAAYEYLRKLQSAERLQPGRYKVLMGPDVTGTFAHEAFGHSQEGDTCVRGRSQAWDLYLQKKSVGNEHATILNNPAIFANADLGYGAWGSYYFDEEGWLAREQLLVEKGILQAPMTNLTSAIRLGVPRTANGKRESWSHGVYTRQTNTYFSAGTETLAELMEKVDYGFLARNSAGGMEDPKGMGIQVGIAYLEEIREGKLTGKVYRGPSGGAVQMTGYTPDYLLSILGKTKIEASSSEPDQAKHPLNTVGGCGKYHKEIVVAGSGGPHMLIDNVLLG